MAEHKDRLLWDMPEVRREVEQWLASDWAPPTRWVIVTGEWEIVPTEKAAADLAECCDEIGFVDPRLPEWWEKHGMEGRKESPWMVSGGTGTMGAWQKHLLGYLQAALEEALRTFPAQHAGHEIKSAVLGQDGYEPAQMSLALEMAGMGILDLEGPPLSDDADTYIRLRYSADPSYMFHADEPDEIWFRHPVLPSDVMAILEAVREHDARESA